MCFSKNNFRSSEALFEARMVDIPQKQVVYTITDQISAALNEISTRFAALLGYQGSQATLSTSARGLIVTPYEMKELMDNNPQ